MARAKGLTVPELIEEIESIVSSGTRVNIGYYLNYLMDEDKQKDAMDYFKSSDTDSVQIAQRELGENDYTEDEIRLIRIKFISEFGN